MKKSQSGFTLIELVVVIVLLGILGVTALGRFQNLAGDAQSAANQGYASEVSGASNINYAASLVNGGGITVNGTSTCANLVGTNATTGLLTSAPPAADFTIGTRSPATCAAIGSTFTCGITGSGTPAGSNGVATIICTASP